MKPFFVCGLILSAFFSGCEGQGKTLPIESLPDQDVPAGVTARSKTSPVLRFTKAVLTVFQDSKGNFWFGSEQEGACRFDGKVYTYFTTEEGLPVNQVRAIQEDSKGNIWFNGQAYFDGKSIVTMRQTGRWNALMDKSQRTPSSSMWQLSPGDTWFSVPNDGVLRYDGELNYLSFPVPVQDSTYYQEKLFLPYFVMTLLKDRNGKMWFGTEGRGVVAYDGKDMTYINPDNFGKDGVRSIFQDKSGNHWFGSNGGGLYHSDGKTTVNFSAKHPSAQLSHVWAINQDNSGDLWFGTPDNGVWRYDGKTWKNYTQEDGLTGNSAIQILKDREGKLWFVTAKGNVHTFNGKSFEAFYRNQSGC